MHLCNLFLQNMLCEIGDTFKNFCIEVRLASMMRAPSPRASRLGTLCASRFLKLSSSNPVKAGPTLGVLLTFLLVVHLNAGDGPYCAAIIDG